MSLALDFILIGIVLFCAFYGYRKGFILSCFNFFGGLISFVLGSMLARPLGSLISDALLKPIFENYFTDALCDFLAERSAATGSGELLSSAEEFFRGFGLNQEVLQTYFESAGNDADQFINSAVSAVSRPIAESLGFAIALVLLFIAFAFLFRFVVKFFDLIAKLPILNFANRSLGFLFGVSYGVLLVIVFSAILAVLEPVIQNSDLPLISEFSLEKTFLLKFLSSILKDFF